MCSLGAVFHPFLRFRDQTMTMYLFHSRAYTCVSTHTYVYLRRVKIIFIRRNQWRSDNLSFSPPPPPPFAVENPSTVFFYLIDMLDSCARDRVVDSEHGSRVPVPIQVASSAHPGEYTIRFHPSVPPPRLYIHIHISPSVNFISLWQAYFFIRSTSAFFIKHISRCSERNYRFFFTTGKFPLFYSLPLYFFRSIYSPPQIN